MRPYQESIVISIGSSNAIVKMPTGSGKTVVAAELLKRRLELDSSLAGLFLVPTQDLVEQQAAVVRAWFPESQVFEFMGGQTDPTTGQANGKVCIVSTPKAFSLLQCRQPNAFGWDQFGIIVFDEVHHMLKDHPYREISLDLRDWNKIKGKGKTQVIGMSASLTYDINEVAIRATLGRLCRELMIDIMISPSLNELERGGYTPQYGDNVEIERSNEIPEGVLAHYLRRPHLMHQTFVKRIETKTATPFALEVWSIVSDLEQHAKHFCPTYMTPLNQIKLTSWEDHAYKHQLNAGNTSAVDVFRLLSIWYTALRLLVLSWEEDKVLVMQWLKANDALRAVHGKDIGTIQEACKTPDSFSKLGRLRYHLIQKRETWGDSFRCIVFVQQRIAAYVISRFIQSDEQLQRHGIISGFVTAKDGKITPEIKMNKSMKQETVTSFRCGVLNVIVATSVLEEVRMVARTLNQASSP
jgi:DEAD/DEAH box helicase